MNFSIPLINVFINRLETIITIPIIELIKLTKRIIKHYQVRLSYERRTKKDC